MAELAAFVGHEWFETAGHICGQTKPTLARGGWGLQSVCTVYSEPTVIDNPEYSKKLRQSLHVDEKIVILVWLFAGVSLLRGFSGHVTPQVWSNPQFWV